MSTFREMVRYRRLRVLRSPVFIIVCLLTLTFSLATVSRYETAGSSMSLIHLVQSYSTLLSLMLLLATALLAGREEDEGSTELVAATPLSSPALFLMKLCSLLPLAAAVFLLVYLPVSVKVAAGWLKASASPAYLFAELGVFLLWLLPTLLFITVLGVILGTLRRGLPLYLLIIFVWLVFFAGIVILHNVLHGNGLLVNAWIWPLLSWYATEMLIPAAPADFWSLLPRLPLLVWQRLFYLALSLLLAGGGLALYRRRRRGAGEITPPHRWGILLTAGLVLVTGTGTYSAYRGLLEPARLEGRYYHELMREAPEQFQIDPAEAFLHLTRYDLRVDLSKPSRLAVEALVEVENTGTESVSPLRLGLKHHFQVTEACAGGSPVRSEQVGDRVVFPDLSLQAGEKIEIGLRYTGAVQGWRTKEFSPGLELHHYSTAYGLNLPPSYGWYPLPPALPPALGIGQRKWARDYAVVDRPLKYDDYSNYEFLLHELQDPSRMSGSDFNSLFSGLARPREALFRVEATFGPGYTPASNLPEQKNGDQQIIFAGEAAYLYLVGWPLQREAVGGGIVYLPPGSDFEAAVEIVQKVRRMQQWFGAPVKEATAVLFPGLPHSPYLAGDCIIDAGESFFLGKIFPVMEFAWSQAACDLLSGFSRELNCTETRLVEAYLEAERRRNGGDPKIENLPDGVYLLPHLTHAEAEESLPSAVEIADWLEGYGAAVENPVHELYRLAQERPLQPEDLDVFKVPPAAPAREAP